MRYSEIATQKASQPKEKIRILGIETSCDDTSAAIVENGTNTLSLVTSSQILLHREFGGVVPEIASRNHTKNIGEVVNGALEQANLTKNDIDAIAVTACPGLLGALLAGVSFAKGLAYALSVPIIAVNHIAGHIAANYITHSELRPPFVCLVASGGHSHIILVRDYMNFEVLGGTCDDAAGEALDKIARELGLPYPGGVYLERLAAEGNENAFGFKSQFNMSESRNFSFSGIKTAAANILHSKADVNKADIAASFQRAVVDTLVFKTILCAQSVSSKQIAIAGGVSANKTLRNKLKIACEKLGMQFFCPDLKYCTDNAAMIASAGYYMLQQDKYNDLSFDARATGDLSRLMDLV